MGFFSPLAWVLRPALFPIVGGMGGLFYGSYDLTVMALRLTPLGARHDSDCTLAHKVTTFASGLGTSAAGIWARSKFDPMPPVPQMDKELIRTANFATKWARTSMHTMRTFPYLWYASSTAAAGVITGATVSLTR